MLLKYSLTCIILQGICKCHCKLRLSSNNTASEEEEDIDWYLNAMDPEDPELLEELKDYYFTFPTDLERKITKRRLGTNYIYVSLATYTAS